MTSKAKIVAVLTAKPGQEQALEDLLRGMTTPSRAEAGNHAWEIWRDPTVTGRFVLNETYRDQQALEAHRASPHFAHYRSVVTSIADREAWVLVPVDLGAASEK